MYINSVSVQRTTHSGCCVPVTQNLQGARGRRTQVPEEVRELVCCNNTPLHYGYTVGTLRQCTYVRTVYTHHFTGHAYTDTVQIIEGHGDELQVKQGWCHSQDTRRKRTHTWQPPRQKPWQPPRQKPWQPPRQKPWQPPRQKPGEIHS